MGLRVNYIKASFKTTEPSLNFVGKWFTKHGQLYTGSIPQFQHVKLTLMGYKCKHVNVTGVRSVSELESVYTAYLDCASVTLLTPPKVDSISASYKINRTCMLGFEQCRENLARSGFIVTDHPKFSGATIRRVDNLKKASTLFPSGSLNFVGYTHLTQIRRVCRDIASCIVKCEHCCTEF